MQAFSGTITSKRSVIRPDATNCAQELLTHLPTVMDFFRCSVRQGRAKGLSVPQLRALIRIDRGGGLSDVACWLGVTLPSASRLISGLVTKGYLSRCECCEDRRVRKLALTTSGKKILSDAFDVSRQAMAGELARLSDADCRDIARAVRLLGSVFADEEAE